MSLAIRRRPLLATRRSRTIAFGVTVAVAAVAATQLTFAEPTGSTTADAFWSAALVAVVAIFGATARRWTWFLPAGVGVIAGDRLAVACAAVAIAIAFVSVLRDTRSRARGALVGALGALALLRAEPMGFHGLSALLTAAAVIPIVVSGHAHAGRAIRRRTRQVAVVAGSVIGLMVAGAALGVVSVQSDVAEGMRAVDGGMDAARDADDDLAAERLGVAARSLTAANATLSSWFVSPAKTLPIIGPNLDAVESLAAQAGEVAEVSSLAAGSADVDALRFVGGRLDPQVVGDMVGPLEQVHSSLDTLNDRVDDVRSPWLLAAVSERIDRLDDQVDDALPEAENALEAVRIAPTLLGADGPQRYLVLFTTPVEARGRAGFPGNYAELVVDDGQLTMPVFGRVGDLEAAGQDRTLTEPAEMVARYGRFDIANTWRNLTMTPDFASVGLAASQLYPQSGGQPIDGVLAIDPTGLAALMRYTGPVELPDLPEPLTADNAEQYLLFDQYLLFEDDNDRRVDVLDEVARTTFDRLTRVDLPGPRVLSEQLDPVTDGGHIQVVTTDMDTFLPLQVLFETGWLAPPTEGTDTVTVTTSNAGGSKIDMYLERSEQYDVTWDPDTGEVSATLRVTLENNAPAEGLPDYVIGNAIGLPTGTNRSFVSIYSPFELEGSRVNGQPVGVQSEVELNRNVYSTFVDIPPGQSVDIELDLAGSVDGRHYRLDLPVQPSVRPDEVAVTVTAEGTTLASRSAIVEGNVARWSGTLDESRTVSVSAPRG